MNASTSARSLPPVIARRFAGHQHPGTAPVRHPSASRERAGGFHPRTATRASSSPSSASSWREDAARWAGALDPAGAESELARITAEIVRHDELYYLDAAPEVTDAEYDRLRLRLEALEAAFPALAREDSPTRRVGAPIPDAHDANDADDADDDEWEALPQVRHATPMQSLQNAFDAEEAAAFVQRARRALGGEFWDGGGDGPGTAGARLAPIRFCAEPKIDGASASVRYERGRLVRCVSRGDGRSGEDVTRQMVGCVGAPQTWGGDPSAWPEVLEVRGEVFIADEDFKAVNAARAARGMRLFKNARNAAAGAMRRLERPAGDGTDAGPLRFLAYGHGEIVGVDWPSQSEFLESLPSLGLSPAPVLRVSENLDHLIAAHAALATAEGRRSLGYRIDGVVYKVDDAGLRRRLGSDARAPRWAVAHKFPAETAVTTLAGVDVQVGRTGALTPVATLDPPVELGGATVGRATLHNFDDAARKGLYVGARVVVERAGDVIPRITGLAEGVPSSSNTVVTSPPTSCPACGSRVTRTVLARGARSKGKKSDPSTSALDALRLEEEEEAAVVRCTGGLRCPAQSVERVVHFVSRDALDIRGLARRQIQRLHDTGAVRSPADLFTLRARFQHLAADPDVISDGGSFAEADARLPEFWVYTSGKDKGKLKRSAKKLFDAIDSVARSVPLDKFIYSLGIPQVGAETAKLFAGRYRTLEAFRDAAAAHDPAVCTADEEPVAGGCDDESRSMTAIDGVGPVVAAVVAEFWAEHANAAVVDAILAAGVVVEPWNADDIIGGDEKGFEPLAGLGVVVTGRVPGMSRDEATAAVERAGGTAQKSVSGKTDLLVVGEGAGRNKAAAAEEKGVRVVDAAAFLRILSGEDAL